LAVLSEVNATLVQFWPNFSALDPIISGVILLRSLMGGVGMIDGG